MRKRLVLLSILFTSLPVLLAIYRVNEYYEYLNIENMKLEKVKDKITDVDEKRLENLEKEL